MVVDDRLLFTEPNATCFAHKNAGAVVESLAGKVPDALIGLLVVLDVFVFPIVAAVQICIIWAHGSRLASAIMLLCYSSPGKRALCSRIKGQMRRRQDVLILRSLRNIGLLHFAISQYSRGKN